MKTITTREITEELRAEIVAAVEAAGLTNPEQVCDWVLDAARRGENWRAELARAVANEAR
jgi:hypothetical protein